MYQDIQIGKIGANPEQPRKFFDQAALDELTASIKANGLLQPIVVRPVDGEDAPYMIVAGERRWRAATAAGLEAIPARILEDVTEETAFVLAITENVSRQDMTIIEEAGAYADLAAAGWSPKKIAGQFGKTETHIQWRLGLLTLRPEVATWVEEGKIKPNLAWHIAQLNPANQMVASTRYLRGDFDSEAEAANFAQGLRMVEQQTSLVTETAPSVEEQEQRQKKKAATTDKLAKVEQIMPLLDELTEVEPAELAVILGAELGRYVREIDRLTNRVQLARRILRQADGIAKAREVTINPAALPAQRTAAKAAPAKPAPAQAAASKPAAKVPAARRPVAKAASAKPTAKDSAGTAAPAEKKPAASAGTAKPKQAEPAEAVASA